MSDFSQQTKGREPPPLEYVTLGKDGPKVSRIGAGIWQEWLSNVGIEQRISVIRRLVNRGVNFFDTAESYSNGADEFVLGRAIREVGREKLHIATKVSGYRLRFHELQKSCEASLSRLGVKEIDLYPIHYPDPFEQIPLKETFKAMEKLYDSGKIRAIGVCNFAVRDLEEAASCLSRADIASNQVRYNLLQRDVEQEVVPYCLRNKVSIVAWSPLAQGLLTGKYLRVSSGPVDQMRKKEPLFQTHNLKEIRRILHVLKQVAERHNRSISQVALNWLLRTNDIVPIPSARDVNQAEENVGAINFRLTEKDISDIDGAYKNMKIEYFP